MKRKIVCLPVEKYHPSSKFDAVWACASLLHLTRENLLNFFAGIGAYLKPGGIIYASGKNGIRTGICGDGRFFLNFDKLLLEEILEAAPCLSARELWYSRDAAEREGFRWMNFILKYRV